MRPLPPSRGPRPTSPQAPDPRRALGRAAEDQVARELEGRGYAIVERNFRKQFGELDLVALRGHRLVFVEVRSQTGTYLASPLDSIDHRKREKLKKIAGFYLEAHLDLGEEVTFAVAAVRFDAAGRPVMTEFFEDAF